MIKRSTGKDDALGMQTGGYKSPCCTIKRDKLARNLSLSVLKQTVSFLTDREALDSQRYRKERLRFSMISLLLTFFVQNVFNHGTSVYKRCKTAFVNVMLFWYAFPVKYTKQNARSRMTRTANSSCNVVLSLLSVLRRDSVSAS